MMDNNLSQKIQLFLTGRNFKDQDVFSKSDPYIQVSFKRDFSRQYQILGRTQTIKNELNPNFAKTFVIDYIFESRQDIRFDVYDDDGNGSKDDYVGFVQTTVGNLMGAKSQTAILDLKNPQKNNELSGKLIVRCQKISESAQYFKFRFAGEKLLNVDSFFDFWDKSDPYLKLLKIRDDNTLIEVFRTETIKDNLNPSWRPIQIQQSRLINPKKESFKIQIWDSQQDGKDQFIGEAIIGPAQLAPGSRIPIVNSKKGDAGALIIQQFAVCKKKSFIDFLRGGLQINTIVAVDFTGSNGNPKFNTSLHFMNPTAPNQYQMAISSIAQILLNYDTDKRIPAYGFGGKPSFPTMKSSQVNHCFPLSGVNQDYEAKSLQHLMFLYQNALTHVQLSGPTLFAPLLYETMKLSAACKQNGSKVYQILLILTDGQIHDMEETVNTIIKGADLPLSIVIVGVGNQQFVNMRSLDGDNGLVSSNGVKCPRDVVQFVPFKEVNMNGDLLARQLLAEVPFQVLQYMSLIGKEPGEYVPLNISAIVPKNIPKPQ